MLLSTVSKAVVEAHVKGYQVINGKVYYKGNIVKTIVGKKNPYKYFSIRTSDKKRNILFVHRLVAYQKYGNNMFAEGIQVRHLNGDALDNTENNISIGTASENNLDKSADMRLKVAIHASSHAKKYDHQEIITLHKSGYSYNQISKLTGIKSKGTISFIIKKSMKANGK